MLNTQFWMSPSFIVAYDFLIKFRDVVEKFGKFLVFEPKYKFKNLVGEFSSDFLKSHCYGQGMYCATSEHILESKSVLDEAIRQKCIWNLSKTDSAAKNLWWSYIGNYRNCLKERLKNTNTKKLDCFDEIMSRHSYSAKTKESIEACYNESFDHTVDKYNSKNKVLKEDENNYEFSGVYLVPAFFINNNLVKENLKVPIVISALCDKLINKPEVCHDYLFATINWDYNHRVNKGHGLITILSLLAVGLLIIFAAVVYVKRSMNQSINAEISQDIKNHVSEYMKLKDSQY